MQIIGSRPRISPQERVISAGVGRVDNLHVEGLLQLTHASVVAVWDSGTDACRQRHDGHGVTSPQGGRRDQRHEASVPRLRTHGNLRVTQ
jgi:hypothetical protein